MHLAQGPELRDRVLLTYFDIMRLLRQRINDLVEHGAAGNNGVVKGQRLDRAAVRRISVKIGTALSFGAIVMRSALVEVVW